MILNQPSDGRFNVLIALTKCLVMQGPLNKQKLLDLCMPQSIDPKQVMATNTLNRWIELGVFDCSEGLVSIAERYSAKLNKKRYCLDELVSVVTEQIFIEGNNKNFWYSEENKSADYCRAQAWMLMQDVYRVRPNSWRDIESLAIEQGVEQEANSEQKCTPDTPRVFGNSARWGGFTAWSEFLGFGTSIFGGHSIDPTRAIRPHVSLLLPKKDSLPVKEFVESLASVIPVLDGGEQRRLVEEKVNRTKWNAPGENELSTSLSRAIFRLHEDGTLEIEDKADAKDKRFLLGRDCKAVRTISHVRIGNKK